MLLNSNTLAPNASTGMYVCKFLQPDQLCYSSVLAVVILSVHLFICLSVRLSVTRVVCDKTKQCTTDTCILIAHERAITLVFWHQQCLAGEAFRLKFALKVTHPLRKNVDFDRFPLIMSQPHTIAKKVQLRRIGS